MLLHLVRKIHVVLYKTMWNSGYSIVLSTRKIARLLENYWYKLNIDGHDFINIS